MTPFAVSHWAVIFLAFVLTFIAAGTACPSLNVSAISITTISCVNNTVDTVCTFDCAAGYVMSSGSFSRTCLASGSWDGTPLVCVTDPCAAGPCKQFSVCVVDFTTQSNFRCDCVEDALGTPGSDGSGCTFTEIITKNGDMHFVVSDLNDIIFNINLQQQFSANNFKARIAAFNNDNSVVNFEVSTTTSTLQASYPPAVDQAFAITVQSLTETILSTIAEAGVTAAEQAVGLVNATQSNIEASAMNYSSLALSSAISAAAALNANLSQSISRSLSSSQASTSSMTASIATSSNNTWSTLKVQSTTVANQATNATTSINNITAISNSFSNIIVAQSAAVWSQLSTLTAQSTTIATQSATVAAKISILVSQSTTVATQSTTLYNQIAMFTTQSTTLAAQSVTVATQSVANLATEASQTSSLTGVLTLFNAIQACSANSQIYYQSVGACVLALTSLTPMPANTPCTFMNTGAMWSYNGAILVCTGTAWLQTGRIPSGSVYSMPGASCAAIVSSGDYVAQGLYWIQVNPNTIIQQLCSSSTSLGGDGSSPIKVALSCSNIYTYFGIASGFAYIDPNLNSSSAVQVYCLNGVSYGGNGTYLAASSVSCNALAQYWHLPAGYYFVNNVNQTCFMRTVLGCQDALELIPTMSSQVVAIQVLGTTYSAWCQIFNGVAWTLMMKINGTSANFAYTSSYWTTSSTLNPGTGVLGGLDLTEFKSPLFEMLPFSQMMIGVIQQGGLTSNINLTASFNISNMNWLTFNYNAPSMSYIFYPELYLPVPAITRASMFKLFNVNSTEANCNLAGFNVNPTNGIRVRIGILTNNENDCLSIDTRIGLGAYGGLYNLANYINTNGWTCGYGCYDVTSKILIIPTPAVADGVYFAYILVR